MKISKYNYIRAIATIMMVITHLGNIDWILESNAPIDIHIIGVPGISFISAYSSFCVPIFAFLTGVLVNVNSERYGSLRYIINKIIKLLIGDWIIYIVFLAIALIYNEPLPNKVNFVVTLLGVRTGVREYANVCFAWYIFFYICALLTIYFFVTKKYTVSLLNNNIFRIIAFIIFEILVFVIVKNSLLYPLALQWLLYMPVTMIGYYAKLYNVGDNVSKLLNKTTRVLLVLSVLCLGILLVFLGLEDSLAIWLYTPMLFFALTEICDRDIDNSVVGEILNIISKYSLDIWLLHGIFYTPSRSLQIIAFWAKYLPVTLLLMLIICIALAVLLEKIKMIIYRTLKI